MTRTLTGLLLLLTTAAVAQERKPDRLVWNADDPAGVAGLERETTLVEEGAAAVRWRHHPEVNNFNVPGFPSDLTGWHILRFRLHSARAVPTKIMALFFSQNPQTDGPDYYGYSLSLDFEGWRTIELPLGGGGTRNPRGWDQIDSLNFTAAGWGNTPHPDADLVFDDFCLVDDPPRPGPVLSDAEFFDALDLTRPDLQAVRTAVDRGDFPAARDALLQHFRDRTTPRWHFDWRDRPEVTIPEGGSDGWDYYGTGLDIDWQGWKTITIPLSEFAASRKPLGWNYITYLMLSASYGDRTPSAELQLALDDVTLVRPGGDKVLYDFEGGEGLADWPGLTANETLADGGGTVGLWASPRTQGNLTSHRVPRDWSDVTALRFRLWSAQATGERITVICNSDTPDLASADRVVAHYAGETYLGERINWSINARDPADPAFTKEWTYGLNRFGHWNILGRAYWTSNDEKYAREWIAQMHSWVEDNPWPRFGTGNDSLTWRTIEAGIRTQSAWPNALYYFLGSPSFTGDDLVVYLKSWVDHARHLMRITVDHPEHGGNWVTMECNGLGHLAILLPEAKDAPLWLSTAVDRMLLELDAQVYPDGAQKELTTGYHQVSLNNFAGLLKFARLNDIDLPPAYLQRLERMYHYNLLLMTPDVALPPVNDSGYAGVRRQLAEGADLFGRDDFRWAATGGAEGTPPDFTSVALPWAGWHVMRSGWDRDDLYGFFEAGPYGTGHQHEDKLNLWLYGLGRVLLTEGGTYSYDQSKYRRFVLGTWSHNTVLVDGQEQRRRQVPESREATAPLDNLWVTNDLFDAANGRYEDGYGPDQIPVLHLRSVVFLKPNLWVVLDRLVGEGTHRYDILWHLKNEDATHDPATQAAWGTDPEVANLLVTPATTPGAAPQHPLALDIVKGREDPVLGWGEMARKTPAPTLNYHLTTTGDTALAWALTPFRGDRPNVTLTLHPEQNGYRLEVTHNGQTDHLWLAAAAEPATVTLAGQTLTGRVAVVRADGRAGAE